MEKKGMRVGMEKHRRERRRSKRELRLKLQHPLLVSSLASKSPSLSSRNSTLL